MGVGIVTGSIGIEEIGGTRRNRTTMSGCECGHGE